jgi:segregation and condensation protein A
MKDIQLDQFEGPLNLLLKLIEDQELDITQISLAEVADQYLKLLHTQESWSADELADFLVIAAKLVLLKSKVLLPSLQLTDEEEGDARELERQLKLLKSYLDASKHVEKLHDREEIARVRIFFHHRT